MPDAHDRRITLALCGDLMTGRGIDQLLPDPCPPILYESWARSAEDYVELAEESCGRIARPVSLAYPWGDALSELDAVKPDARIVNLETALTRSDEAWPGKGIHYRTSPENARMLAVAGIDCCTLANNHVLDWGHAGLEETLRTLRTLDVGHAGAGIDRAEAEAPAVIELAGGGRVLVFSFAASSSGVPKSWAATETLPGVALLRDLSEPTRDRIGELVQSHKRDGDVVIFSVHWGGNWGFEVSREQRAFARGLVETADVDVVHGHSSHHVKGIEVHKGRPILYGCGDFLNDYEGIHGHEAFRGDLGLLYFVTLDPARGGLARLLVTPTRIERFQVRRALAEDARWLADTLNREGRQFATSVVPTGEGRLELQWNSGEGRSPSYG
jgi:poly-gamma-glutamate synthesis protein (capsule biosynthesis protein)